MKDDPIERIWKEPIEDTPMTQQQLAVIIEPRARSASKRLDRHVWAFLLLQLGTLLLACANLVQYRSNGTMLAVEAGVLILALVFGAYGLTLRGAVRDLDQLGDPLDKTLRRRLAFLDTHATIWIWVAALSIAAFAFALNTLIDGTNGQYAINKPWVFVGVQAAMLLLLYGSFRVVLAPYLHEQRAMLADLEAQVLDKTIDVDRDLARWQSWRIGLVVLLAALMALGAWLALRT